MNRTTLDLWVGIFVAIGLASLLFLAMKVGNLASSGSGETYRLEARFDNVGGLKIRGAVKSAGVVIGRITGIKLDPDEYAAIVDMQIDQRYHFDRDSIATMNSSGLLGEQYIGLEVGGSDDMLQNGDTIRMSQSAVVLEKLISQFMFSKAAEDSPETGK